MSMEARHGRPVLFRCPETGTYLQHQLDDDPDISENEYEAITCLDCGKLHLVNRKTDKALSQDH
jgi:predicted nucleic-acid-binding Zn-ribbon protein